ncbi:hypothetical protein MIMGU_mgv1a015253mg [Erythranthe guttata]|uniref:Uncharacterized protein n=1 Tax=Erythranthe guttata TaxID=4155 RepID=A0A022RYE2_ERYGU|nr:PREDICTED: uncharacterized protein LOC105949721 [Erythranthe guttata]EYU43975.1 hypothetical protein MIMGU_mgv1a015253mg [Erythranthe guttata]|eukprot:XP_012828495.1 PREDICTED: uncharacterized protein LOC105949721 [Erythranthe guttata]
MSNKPPIFPILPPQHFTDYGFEPQIDYFQVMEEARKHKRESRSIDLHFKLQKPISKDKKNTKKRWWRNSLLDFFKLPKWAEPPSSAAATGAARRHHHHHRIGSISSPVYITESRSGSSSPYRNAGRVPGGGAAAEIPYMSLRELNMDDNHRISTTATPIYLVT